MNKIILSRIKRETHSIGYNLSLIRSRAETIISHTFNFFLFKQFIEVDIPISFDGSPLRQAHSIKFLGIFLDEKSYLETLY